MLENHTFSLLTIQYIRTKAFGEKIIRGGKRESFPSLQISKKYLLCILTIINKEDVESVYLTYRVADRKRLYTDVLLLA